MAEALDLTIVGQSKDGQVAVALRTQIPMELAIAYRATATTAIATNGSKAAAFGIKPKGVRDE